MPIYLHDLLDAASLEEGGGDALLDAEDDALGGGDADGGAAEFDGFEAVFDLEEAAFGREGVDAAVVFAAGYEHFGGVCGCWGVWRKRLV